MLWFFILRSSQFFKNGILGSCSIFSYAPTPHSFSFRFYFLDSIFCLPKKKQLVSWLIHWQQKKMSTPFIFFYFFFFKFFSTPKDLKKKQVVNCPPSLLLHFFPFFFGEEWENWPATWGNSFFVCLVRKQKEKDKTIFAKFLQTIKIHFCKRQK